VFGETCESKSKDVYFKRSPKEQLAGDMLLPANCSTRQLYKKINKWENPCTVKNIKDKKFKSKKYVIGFGW